MVGLSFVTRPQLAQTPTSRGEVRASGPFQIGQFARSARVKMRNAGQRLSKRQNCARRSYLLPQREGVKRKRVEDGLAKWRQWNRSRVGCFCLNSNIGASFFALFGATIDRVMFCGVGVNPHIVSMHDLPAIGAFSQIKLSLV